MFLITSQTEMAWVWATIYWALLLGFFLKYTDHFGFKTNKSWNSKARLRFSSLLLFFQVFGLPLQLFKTQKEVELELKAWKDYWASFLFVSFRAW